MNELSAGQLRALRLAAQRLTPRAPRSALADVVRAVVGIQAQLSPAMMLALRPRVEGLEMADVHAAIGEDRSLVRTWSMRGTLHLSAAEDVRWLVGLLGPVFMAGGKPRRLQLGLDDETLRRGITAISEILIPGEVVTRDVIVERLNKVGFALDRKTQAPIHLIGQAAHAGVIVLGPDAAGGKSTYTLAESWLPPGEPVSGRYAAALLARRYVTGYGPADLADFSAWSGLPVSLAQEGWSDALAGGGWAEVRVEGRALWVDAGALDAAVPQGRTVRLLPAFDTVVLGYKQRADVVSPEHQPQVYHGGQTVPVVMVDGLAAGVWRYERGTRQILISVQAFNAFDAETTRLIRTEADDIGRFTGLPAILEIS